MVPPKSSFVSSTHEAIIKTHHIGYADAFLLLLNSIEIGILLPLAHLCGYRIGQSKKAQTRRDGLGCDVRGATGSGWIESYVFTSAVTSCGSTFMYISAVHAWPGYFFRIYVAVVIIITFIITFPRAFMCTK